MCSYGFEFREQYVRPRKVVLPVLRGLQRPRPTVMTSHTCSFRVLLRAVLMTTLLVDVVSKGDLERRGVEGRLGSVRGKCREKKKISFLTN